MPDTVTGILYELSQLMLPSPVKLMALYFHFIVLETKLTCAK